MIFKSWHSGLHWPSFIFISCFNFTYSALVLQPWAFLSFPFQWKGWLWHRCSYFIDVTISSAFLGYCIAAYLSIPETLMISEMAKSTVILIMWKIQIFLGSGLHGVFCVCKRLECVHFNQGHGQTWTFSSYFRHRHWPVRFLTNFSAFSQWAINALFRCRQSKHRYS